MLNGRRILLIISGGIAAYKSLDLIRRLRERGCRVRCVLTAGGAQFVTPLSIATLSRDKVYRDLFSLTDESEIGHIRLARECDLVVVAPATADLLAKTANGLADDLASTVLLATNQPILVAPAMNFVMWESAATRANLERLRSRGVRTIGPEAGERAESEVGMGRMSEPLAIVAAIEEFFGAAGPLKGRRALITSGPTHEPIDPVRFIANPPSRNQGHAIAAALAGLGADTNLVTGPTQQPNPPGVKVSRIETAAEMLAACKATLPVNGAGFAAAVADWRTAERRNQKLKKNRKLPVLELVENPDILATLAAPGSTRPRLGIGFAAETENVVQNATAKRLKKGCDWIVANDVSAAAGTFGGDPNSVHVIDPGGAESWPRLTKDEVAHRLAERIAPPIP